MSGMELPDQAASGKKMSEKNLHQNALHQRIRDLCAKKTKAGISPGFGLRSIASWLPEETMFHRDSIDPAK